MSFAIVDGTDLKRLTADGLKTLQLCLHLHLRLHLRLHLHLRLRLRLCLRFRVCLRLRLRLRLRVCLHLRLRLRLHLHLRLRSSRCASSNMRAVFLTSALWPYYNGVFGDRPIFAIPVLYTLCSG